MTDQAKVQICTMKCRSLVFVYAAILSFFPACKLNTKVPLKTDEVRQLEVNRTTKAEIEQKYGRPQKDFLTDNHYLACYIGKGENYLDPWRLLLVAYDRKDTMVKINLDDDLAKKQCRELLPDTGHTMGSSSSFDAASCTAKGKRMYGKFKQVERFEDVKVQVVSAFPDLKVKTVRNFADSCGEWEFVDVFEDTKIKFVERDADVKIQYVDAFPGPG